MSRQDDHPAQRLWAQGIRLLLGEALYHAFIARPQFRRHPILSLVEIWREHRHGGIGLSETVQFAPGRPLRKTVGARAAAKLVANQR